MVILRFLSDVASHQFLQGRFFSRSIAIPLLLILAALVTGGKADTFGDFTYTTNSTSATITAYTGPGGDVTIPETILDKPVTGIGIGAFFGSTNLTNITIPKSVTKIGDKAFVGCSALTSFSVDSMNLAFSSPDGVLFSKDMLTLVACPAGRTGSYSITNTVTTVGNYAFSDCVGLTNISLPTNTYTLGSNSFYNCTGLTGIIIPEKISTVRDSAFHGCSGLTSITIPRSVKSLGNDAFGYCTNLTNVFIQGNGPTLVPPGLPFGQSDLVTVYYYYPYKLAWKSTFGGRPALLFIDANAADYTYKVLMSTATLTGYKGSNENVVIPNTIDSLPIVGIGDKAFAGAGNVRSISIPNTVTNIGNNTFSACIHLTNITLPCNITTIPESAFEYCRELLSVVIPNKVTKIGDFAFIDCRSLTNVIIPDSVTNIGGAAFRYCAGLTSISVPSGVSVISSGMFEGCTGLTQFTIPYCATAIGTYAFADCSALANLNIPNTVTFIGGWAFSGCRSLTDLTIPEGVTIIDTSTFYGCSALTNIIIPCSVSSIGTQAFVGCASLKDISIPEAVSSIPTSALSGCSSLTTITLSSNITHIAYASLNGCSNLKTILVELGNKYFTSLDGVLFNKDITTLISCPGSRKGSYTIPESVTTIESFAFGGCTGLTNVLIPSSVKSIGGRAFEYCSGLSQLVVPDGVTNIAYMAFKGCSNLASIEIPARVVNIDPNSFIDCTNLSAINVDTLNTVYASMDGVMFDNTFTTLVQFPTGKHGSYIIPSGVTNVGATAFYTCNGLTNITIPESLTNMTFMFYEGDGITANNIDPRNPGYISVNGVVFNRDMTTLIKYPAGVIGGYIIPNSVTNIGSGAFMGCKRLASITIPTSVTGIGNSAFSGCKRLTNIIIPEGVPKIGYSTFSYCDNLVSITIPGSVTNTDSGAFSDCKSLTGVYFKGNNPNPIGPLLFENTPDVTVYYRVGATGWKSTLDNKPTALWIEQPTYQEWAQGTGLLEKFPDATAETDDADQDGMSNRAEMQAGTDPTKPDSMMKFENAPRLEDLAEADKSDIGEDQHALYFQTVPGKAYEIHSVAAIGGNWEWVTNVTATTTQKRVVVRKPVDQAFYRLVLLP